MRENDATEPRLLTLLVEVETTCPKCASGVAYFRKAPLTSPHENPGTTLRLIPGYDEAGKFTHWHIDVSLHDFGATGNDIVEV